MLVCLSVKGLRLKYTDLYAYFTYLLARAAHDAAWRSRSRTRKIEDDARTSPDVRKTVNCSTKG